MASSVLHVRLTEGELRRLETTARQQAMPTSTLARVLIVQGLNQPDVIEVFFSALEQDPKLRYRLQRILITMNQEP